MEGEWSGYDLKHQTVYSGKYLFYPFIDNIEIIEYNHSHYSDVIRISQNELEDGFLEQIDTKNIDREKNFIYLAKIHEKSKTIGFLYYEKTTCGKLLNKSQFSSLKNNFLLKNNNLLIINIIAIAVEDNYKNQGVASKLIHAVLKEEMTDENTIGMFKLDICQDKENSQKIKEYENMKNILKKANFMPFNGDSQFIIYYINIDVGVNKSRSDN